MDQLHLLENPGESEAASTAGSMRARTPGGTSRRELSVPEPAATVAGPVSPSSLASVAVGRPVRGEFTYVIPEDMTGRLEPGQRIHVPFGRGTALGFFLGPASSPVEEGIQLKPIQRVLEESPSLPPDLIGVWVLLPEAVS